VNTIIWDANERLSQYNLVNVLRNSFPGENESESESRWGCFKIQQEKCVSGK